MAERKNTGKKPNQTRKKTSTQAGKKQTLPLAAIFWLVFFIVITGFFLANRETISKNFDILTRRLGIAAGKEPAPPLENDEADPPEVQADEQTAAPPVPVQTPPSRPEEKPRSEKTETPRQPAVSPPAAQTQTPAQTRPSQPASQPAEKPAAKPAQTRERSVYFTQVDKDGAILRSKVTRTVAASDSPMRDSLDALLAGPSAEEQRAGVISLIPPNTRVLSSTIRGSTAYISFSEEFQYNTYGVEGYAAQLKQIVWTATEFPTVSDVQILIEGRRVDYLGEGIWIGSPVSRESL